MTAMMLKFKTFYRAYIGVLLLVFCWAFWLSAQPADTSAAETKPVAVAGQGSPTTTLTNLVHSDYLTFGLNKIPVLTDNKVFDEPIWKYLASLIYIFLAFYISKFLDFLTGVWLKKWAAKTETQLDDLLLEALRGPVKVVAFVIFLHIGLEVFNWPETVQKFLSKGLVVIVAFSLTYVTLKVVDVLMGVWRARVSADADQTFNQQLYPLVRKSLKVFIVVVAVLVTAQNLDINITSAIASLSIGGLALGLAAQDTLANMFGAVSVFVDKPFRIGDRIQLEGVDGPVESIGLRSTRVRNLDGHLITIPNKTMGNATITNVTSRPNIKTIMNIGITYDTPTDKVKRALAILEEVYQKHPKTSEVWISFNKFADFSLNIMVVHWWGSTDYKEYLGGMQELNLTIKERFDAEKIECAFPTQTLYLKEGDAPPTA